MNISVMDKKKEYYWILDMEEKNLKQISERKLQNDDNGYSSPYISKKFNDRYIAFDIRKFTYQDGLSVDTINVIDGQNGKLVYSGSFSKFVVEITYDQDSNSLWIFDETGQVFAVDVTKKETVEQETFSLGNKKLFREISGSKDIYIAYEQYDRYLYIFKKKKQAEKNWEIVIDYSGYSEESQDFSYIMDEKSAYFVEYSSHLIRIYNNGDVINECTIPEGEDEIFIENVKLLNSSWIIFDISDPYYSSMYFYKWNLRTDSLEEMRDFLYNEYEEGKSVMVRAADDGTVYIYQAAEGVVKCFVLSDNGDDILMTEKNIPKNIGVNYMVDMQEYLDKKGNITLFYKHIDDSQEDDWCIPVVTIGDFSVELSDVGRFKYRNCRDLSSAYGEKYFAIQANNNIYVYSSLDGKLISNIDTGIESSFYNQICWMPNTTNVVLCTELEARINDALSGQLVQKLDFSDYRRLDGSVIFFNILYDNNNDEYIFKRGDTAFVISKDLSEPKTIIRNFAFLDKFNDSYTIWYDNFNHSKRGYISFQRYSSEEIYEMSKRY